MLKYIENVKLSALCSGVRTCLEYRVTEKAAIPFLSLKYLILVMRLGVALLTKLEIAWDVEIHSNKSSSGGNFK